MITEDNAKELAIIELEKQGFEFIKNSADAFYRDRKLSVGIEKKGWVVSFLLRVPETMEPNMVYVHVSDPDGKIYVPPVM